QNTRQGQSYLIDALLKLAGPEASQYIAVAALKIGTGLLGDPCRRPGAYPRRLSAPTGLPDFWAGRLVEFRRLTRRDLDGDRDFDGLCAHRSVQFRNARNRERSCRALRRFGHRRRGEAGGGSPLAEELGSARASPA